MTVPFTWPSTSRRSAVTLGPVVLASARIVRIEPTPTARSRTRDGSPWMTSRVAAAPPPKNVAVHRRGQERVARDPAW